MRLAESARRTRLILLLAEGLTWAEIRTTLDCSDSYIDGLLESMTRDFSRLYFNFGRPSIPPEQMLRALLLTVFYSIRSERLLVEQLDSNLLLRWFVGLGTDDQVWNASSFSKNRERFLDGEIAAKFFERVLAEVRV